MYKEKGKERERRKQVGRGPWKGDIENEGR